MSISHVGSRVIKFLKQFSRVVHSLLLCTMLLHGVSEKTVQNCFCQNFVKFPSILIIFGRKMATWLKLYATYTFSTSPHSCHRTTLLNPKVLNCYITLK